MINPERLSRFFLELAHIESPSREEGEVARYLQEKFSALGARCLFDDSAPKTGSQVGNLVVKWPAEANIPLLFMAAHMDTVKPTQNPRITLKNGVFRSDGRTVCGADDKSALAIFLELVHVLKEQGLKYPLEFILTTCEEIGLLGAKHLNFDLVSAPFGYAWDSEDPHELILRAPEAIRFQIKVLGLAAHAGLNPEEGINAIQVAAHALTRVPLGRLDEETTANIGVIKGGTATNIVPEEVTLFGEIRAHDHQKLEKQWAVLVECFQAATSGPKKKDRPRVEFSREQDYPLMHVPEEHEVVRLAQRAASKLGHPLRLTSTGGGSDANIFNGQGLPCVICGTGMRRVHSTEEYLPLEDLIKAAKFCLQIVWEAGNAG